jgi:O-antigen/teichoic acid export membrane protein
VSLVTICILDVFLEGCFTTLLVTLNVTHQINKVTPLLILSRGGRLVGLIILISMHNASPVEYAAGRLVATLIATIVALAVIQPIISMRPGDLKPIWRESLPYGLSDLLANIYIQADVTLLTVLSGNKQQIGNYSPATGLISALFVIPYSVYAVIIPILTRGFENDPGRIRSRIYKSFLGFFLVGLALFACVFLGGKALSIFLFTQKYEQTGALLVILSPIILLKSVEYAAAAVLVAVTWQSRRLIPQIVSALLNVGINVAVIPILGVSGVAWAYVISEVILAFGYLAIVGAWLFHNPENAIGT